MPNILSVTGTQTRFRARCTKPYRRVERRESLLAAPQPVFNHPGAFRKTWLVQFPNPPRLATADGQRSRWQLTLVLARLWRTRASWRTSPERTHSLPGGCAEPLIEHLAQCLLPCVWWRVHSARAAMWSNSVTEEHSLPRAAGFRYSQVLSALSGRHTTRLWAGRHNVSGPRAADD